MKLDRTKLMQLSLTASPEVAAMAHELMALRARGVGGQIEPSFISPHTHSVIRELDVLRVAGSITIKELTFRAGIATISWHHWTSARRVPRLVDVEAVANVLGHHLTLEKKDE